MKKIKLSLFLIILLSSLSLANYPLGVGRTQLNCGFGFSGWGLPVYLGFDYGIASDFSLGGEFSYRNYREKWHSYYYDHSILAIGMNGNYHFNRLLKMSRKGDLYAGLNIGFIFFNSPDEYKGSRASGLGLGVQIGGRYYFNPNFGINLELGAGRIHNGKFGISYIF